MTLRRARTSCSGAIPDGSVSAPLHRAFIGRRLHGTSLADLQARVRFTIHAGEALGTEFQAAMDALNAGQIVVVESDRREACDRVWRQLAAWCTPRQNAGRA
jgi:hypothetical protein